MSISEQNTMNECKDGLKLFWEQTTTFHIVVWTIYWQILSCTFFRSCITHACLPSPSSLPLYPTGQLWQYDPYGEYYSNIPSVLSSYIPRSVWLSGCICVWRLKTVGKCVNSRTSGSVCRPCKWERWGSKYMCISASDSPSALHSRD